MTESVISLSRYILPTLAVIILMLCLAALLRRHPQSLGEIKLINVSTGDSFPVSSREVSVGRHKNCDVILNYPTVSRQHAVLFFDKDGWYIKAVNSSSPVFVNGNPVEKRALVSSGDFIKLGEVTLRFSNKFIQRTK